MSVNAGPHYHLPPLFYRTRANIRINFILPETTVPAEDLRRWHCNSICISFMQLFSKVARSEARQTGVKQNLTRNSHSRLLKVIQFEIPENPTMDCVSLYNNALALSLKISEETASENATLKIAVVDNYI